MSLILVIHLILIGMSSEEEVEELISVNRICKEQKDYVDGSVIFRNSFWVFVDRMYYEFSWDTNPFVYKAEGLQELALREYDRTWKKSGDENVQAGRFLGGFYHNRIPCNFVVNRTNLDTCEFDMEHHPYWLPDRFNEFSNLTKGKQPGQVNNVNIYTAGQYRNLMSQRQVVVFKDEHNNKVKYHIKMRATEDGLIELSQSNFSFNNVTPRGSINSFLPLDKWKNTRPESIPMIFDYIGLTIYVIINQKDFNDVPLLYYNSFKLKDFQNGWKSVPIPKGYRYNAFIPLMWSRFIELERESPFIFIYRVIAEPFRDINKDKNRGPSFLFNFVPTTPPSLNLLSETGMSVFGCKYLPPSSYILYLVFAIIIVVLLATLLLILGFFSINYFFGKQRIVIVRRSYRQPTKADNSAPKPTISLKRSPQRNKTDTESEEKRTTSLPADQGAADQGAASSRKQIII